MGRDCRFRIVEASRGKDGEATLSEKDAGKLLDEIKEAAQKRIGEGVDLDDALVAEIAERKLLAKQNGQIQKRNALINLTKKKEITTKLDGLIADGATGGQAMKALLVGIEGVYNGGRASVDSKIKTLEATFLKDMVRELDKAGLTRIVNEKAMLPDIEKELWELSKGGKPATKSKEALEVAKIIHRTQEAMRQRMNRAGAQVDKLESYTTTQTHDRTKMRNEGYEKWRDTILPLLDKERTFKGADAEDFLKSSFEVLTTGISKKAPDEGKLFQFKGPANLAKKISKPRVLHFKDAESAIAYRTDFGQSDFFEGVLSNIQNSARNIAMMETFGTNPDAMFDTILSDLRKQYRDNDKVVKDLINPRMIQNFYDEVSGKTQIPESPTLAKVGSVLRAVQTMSKLGGAVISSITDIPSKAIELQYQGFGLADSYGIALGDVVKGMGNKERKELGSMIGVTMDGVMGSIASRFTAQDDLPGMMSKMQRTFFKLNGLQWWTEAQKTGTALAMSHRLAQFKGMSYGELDEATARLFKVHDITENDWELIRKSATKMQDDREYITSDAIRDLPDNLFKNVRDKEKLEDKLRGYFIDRVDYATITPGAKERAYLTQGLKRGTVEGELFRLMTQFKSFPVSVISKSYGRMLYGKGKADIPAMTQLMVMSTLFGYLAMSGKDLIKGREPRPLNDPKTFMAAFTQGGGAGIMGDFILGEYNRFGQDFTTTLMGPTFSSANELAKIYSAARNGDDTAAKSLNFAINNAPFANLFYVRPALNYMFLYQMQESLNPGYLRRMERRVERENNQKFLIKPTAFD